MSDSLVYRQQERTWQLFESVKWDSLKNATEKCHQMGKQRRADQTASLSSANRILWRVPLEKDLLDGRNFFFLPPFIWLSYDLHSLQTLTSIEIALKNANNERKQKYLIWIKT